MTSSKHGSIRGLIYSIDTGTAGRQILPSTILQGYDLSGHLWSSLIILAEKDQPKANVSSAFWQPENATKVKMQI